LNTPLLTTKLYIPAPRLNLVSRPRLIKRLDQGLRLGNRLTLVSAPAGSGKTTLLNEWVAGMPNHVAWVSLDAEDNDRVRFWTYLIAALQTICPDPSMRSGLALGQAVLHALDSPQPPSTQSVLTPLLNDIAALPEKVILVLDDYHAISSDVIHEGIAFLLARQPQRLHLVVSTRADPPLPVARLRARGQLTELRGTDLRFSSGEVAAFLNEAMSLDLLLEDVEALGARTEGWIVGLQLAALSLQGRSNAHEFIAAFTGSHYYVLEYLTEEVLHRQPEPVQRFLLHTSILDRLSGPLCDAVTGRDDGNAMLEHLHRGNLFVIPLDEEHQWYRYHRLFADLLGNLLRKSLRKERILELHGLASEWHEAGGSQNEAVNYALKAEDYERVARLVEEVAHASVVDSRLSTLWYWLEELPEEVLDAHPRLRIYLIWAFYLGGHFIRAQGMLRDSKRALQNLGPSPGNDALREELSGLLAAMETVAAGLMVAFSGDMEEASRTCSQARELAEVAGSVLLVAQATEGLALACYHQGRLRESARYCQEVVDLAERSGRVDRQASHLPFAAAGYVELAGIYLEWNDLNAVASNLEKGAELSRQVGVSQSLADSHVMESRLKQAQGDIEGACDALQAAESVMPRQGPYSIPLYRLALQRARLNLAVGRVDEVERWAEELDSAFVAANGVRSLPTTLFESLRTMLARVRLTRGAPEKALAALDPLMAPAEAASRFGRVIEVCLLKALALQVQGNNSAAIASLGRSLALAEPEGYVRLYLDEGAPVARLLETFCHDSATAPHLQRYAQQLLEAFGDATKDERAETELSEDASPALRPLSLIEPLTKRELEVLHLISEGLSNQEIAHRLVLSLNTVKRHTSNIYGKLAVGSRTQAIARARELGLLSPRS